MDVHLSATFSFKSDRSISDSEIENLSCFESLKNYTFEEAKKTIQESKIKGLFLLLKGERENEYQVVVSQNDYTLSEFLIVSDRAGCKCKIGGIERIFQDIQQAVSVCGGFIPFSFYYKLLKAGFFLSNTSKKELEEKSIKEISELSKRLSIRPTTLQAFIFFPSEYGELTLFLTYKEKEEAWKAVFGTLGANSFNHDFKLVINDLSAVKAFNELTHKTFKSAAIIIEPTLESLNQHLFYKALPLPLIIEHYKKLAENEAEKRSL